jgi:putative FmdB family regulatory protein
MRYDYKCLKCKKLFEVEKRITEPDPESCPHCKSKKIERYFCPENLPGVLYTDRPPWTYKEARKYKTAKYKGREFKIDPSKHGDIGSWNSPGELVKPTKKKKR